MKLNHWGTDVLGADRRGGNGGSNRGGADFQRVCSFPQLGLKVWCRSTGGVCVGGGDGCVWGGGGGGGRFPGADFLIPVKNWWSSFRGEGT